MTSQVDGFADSKPHWRCWRCDSSRYKIRKGYPRNWYLGGTYFTQLPTRDMILRSDKEVILDG